MLMHDNTPLEVSTRAYSFFVDVCEERMCLSVNLISRGGGPRSLIVNDNPS